MGDEIVQKMEQLDVNTEANGPAGDHVQKQQQPMQNGGGAVAQNGTAEQENGETSPRPEDRKIEHYKNYLQQDDMKYYIVDSTQAFDDIIKQFRKDIQEFRILSVDSESSLSQYQNGQRKIDLLQIGSMNGHAYLFRLSMLSRGEINYLRNIIADATIVKIGSLFQSDARRLANDWQMYSHNWIDVQNIALNSLRRRMVGKNQGLKPITMTFTGVELENFDPHTMGNWGAEQLTEHQAKYAARNVLAIIDVFCSIYANRMRLSAISIDDIKQHIAWARFYSNSFWSAFP